MKKLIVFSLFFTCQYLAQESGTIVINEIMYSPKSGEPEWIELFNKSSGIISLKDWKVLDNNSQVKISDNQIYPNEYIIFCKDSSIRNIFGNEFRIIYLKMPSLNNSGDVVCIKNSKDEIIDSIEYIPEWGGESGKSLERLSSNESSTQKDNWGTSRNNFGGTPGFINSLSKKLFDIEVSQVIFKNTFVAEQQRNNIAGKIINKGSGAAEFYIRLFELNVNEILLEESNTLFLLPGDSLIYQFKFINENIDREKTFCIDALCNSDEDTSNNKLCSILYPSYNKLSLVISEIMFDPSSGNSEFIELYNPGTEDINLRGWNFCSTDKKFILCDDDFYMPGNSYFILAADSCIYNNYNWLNKSNSKISGKSLGLINSGCSLSILDMNGNVIDSLLYSDSWHNRNIISSKNKSLERISLLSESNNAGNWSTCVDNYGATPAKENSIALTETVSENKIDISPNPFSPDNDGYEDFTIIEYNLDKQLSQLRLKIFDSQGRLVRTILDNTPGASAGQIIFDGLDDNSNALRIGIYIVLLEVLDNSGIIVVIKKALVIARKL